jgi:putative selenium-binding protein YdfZ
MTETAMRSQRVNVMIAATGAVDFLKEAHTDNLTPYQAEHEKCVLLANSGSSTPPSS